jgi:hypothetical protein
MKPDHAPHAAGGESRRRNRTDFLFVGLGVLPLGLMLGGLPELALLLFLPLLFVACFHGMSEQLEDARDVAAGFEPRAGAKKTGKPAAAGVSLRNPLKR